MRKFRRRRQWKNAGYAACGAVWLLQSTAWAQPEAKGLAAYSSLLTNGFFILLATFVGLVIWEVLDGRKSSRSSLDIAKLAAAAAKKQSAAGAPSGSLASLEAPPTSRPFAPPPPPPPPRPAAEASQEAVPAASPFTPVSESMESSNPFAAPPREMAGDSPSSLESTIAFNPGADPGGSGGWADLLQRVRAGEPEAGAFPSSASPPSTEDEGSQTLSAPPAASSASSSEAWEALLKRTTSGENPLSKAPPSDIGKISLGSTSPAFPPSSTPSFGDDSAFVLPSSTPSFGDDSAFSLPTSPSSGFSLPPASPPPGDSSATLGFSFSPESSSEAASPFSLPPTPAASGFEAPSFKLPGGGADEGSSFQLPGGNSPFDFGASSEGSSTSTLPLSDLFSSKSTPPASPPAFQLPTGSGSSDPFGSSDDIGVARTISLDFAKGGGQKPPPPLPKTEG